MGVKFDREHREAFPEDEAARQEWIAEQDRRQAELQNNPHIAGKTPKAGIRTTAVQRATELEVELVRRTGKGTVDWTPEEIQFIKQEGRLPPGVEGHHINNVNKFSEWAGDPRNIKFVRGRGGNLAEHGGNYQNPTTGPLIDRRAMIDQATGGTK